MRSPNSHSADVLRDRAEALIAQAVHGHAEAADLERVRALAHELAVHQAELELQNAELRDAQDALEQTRDRYALLFSRAPVGYVVLDASGMIRQTNATWGVMTGQADENPVGHPFADRLVEEDAQIFLSRFHAFFRNPSDKHIAVRIKRKGAAPFHARLEARLHEPRRGRDEPQDQELLVIVSDLSDLQETRLALENRNAELDATQDALQRYSARLKAVADILQHECSDMQEFLDYALDKAISITASKIGYIYFYDEEKREFILNTWSKDVMKQCAVANPQTCYALDKTGIWGEAVRQRRPIVLNNFQAQHPLKKGYPEGHVALLRFLTVPVFYQGRIVAVAAVANKGTDYDDSDTSELSLLMDAVWKSAESLKNRQALQRNEAYQRKILETTADGFWIIGADGGITEVNNAYCVMSGYPRDELLGMRIGDLDADETPEITRQRIEKIMRTGSDVFETHHRRKDGVVFPVEVSVSYMDERGGQMVCFCRDLTRRNRDAEHLRVLGQMLDLAPASICIHDVAGNFYYVNAAMVSRYGYGSLKAFLQLNLKDISATHDEDALAARFSQIDATGEVRFESVHRRKDGSTFPIEVQARKIVWKDRSAVLSIATDMTAHKRFEEVLMTNNQALKTATEQANQMAQKAQVGSKVKSEFLANMSHEIRTPMNGVIGMTDLLLDTKLTEQQRKYALTVKSSGEALLTVINDILDFSKIEAGKLEIETLDFDLRETLDSVAHIILHQAQTKGLVYRSTVAADVPSAVVGDPVRLRQILLNLTSNAVKFTKAGEVAVTVSVVAPHTPDGGTANSPSDASTLLRFSVRDTGIGISEEGMRRLFQQFSQVDGSMTRKYGGTGLGLAISKQLTELMGGLIGVESEEGKGSEFWFTLPLRHATKQVNVQAESAKTPLAKRFADRHIRLLLAEDDLTNRIVAQEILKKLGLTHVDTVVNGRDAVAAVAKHTYDLVLMDVQMPEMDGLAATQEIRRMREDRAVNGGRHLPIIAMTAHTMQGDRENCENAGMDDYLTKPISGLALAEVIGRWLPK